MSLVHSCYNSVDQTCFLQIMLHHILIFGEFCLIEFMEKWVWEWLVRCVLMSCNVLISKLDSHNDSSTILTMLDPHYRENRHKQTDLRDLSQLRMGEGYSWVPPGLSQSKIEEYMKQLPPDKVPKLGGSHGERYRERQLQLQLPKQDLSSRYCSHLEPLHQVYNNI